MSSIAMTESEAIAAARTVAEAEGWLWLEPALATRRVAGDGSVVWEIYSNAMALGAKVRVKLADGGEVLSSGYIPR